MRHVLRGPSRRRDMYTHAANIVCIGKYIWLMEMRKCICVVYVYIYVRGRKARKLLDN